MFLSTTPFYKLNTFLFKHKLRIFTEYHSVCPLVGIGTLPPPYLASECAPPPGTKEWGGHTRLRVRGWGSQNSDDWRKSLARCLLCVLCLYKLQKKPPVLRREYLCSLNMIILIFISFLPSRIGILQHC
jgi:hypothetical protein